MKYWITGMSGALGCVATWWILDTYVFGHNYGHDYYIGVFCAYCGGYGLPRFGNPVEGSR